MANIEHRLREIRADWANSGFSFEYWIDPPGQVWRDFVHEHDERVILVEGETRSAARACALRSEKKC